MNKIYYSSKSSIGKQVLAYLTASFKNLLAIDITKTNVTGTQWKELAVHHKVNIKDVLFEEALNLSQNENGSTNLHDNDWIKVLQNNP